MKQKKYSVKWKTLQQVMDEKMAMNTPENRKEMLKAAEEMFN